jgi:S-formylglutathione hydrolase FrmB
MIYLHGYLEDERSFLKYVVKPIDDAILVGKLPPLIVAAPDGTLSGRPSLHEPHSWYLNSSMGDFQDWVVCDLWEFITSHYPILPEREAHVLAGTSAGAFGAYNIAIKHNHLFKVVIGVFPALNLRWMDLNCNYMANFNPCSWGWRNSNDNPHEVLGSFYGGLLKLRMRDIIYPVFGQGPKAILRASMENPIEMIDRFGIKNGTLDMFIGYAGRDEFNIDAQVESFLYFIDARRIKATVSYAPEGNHSAETATSMFPGIIDWLSVRLLPYCGPIQK